VLLHGNRSLSFVKDERNGLRPVEMDLQPIGFSFEKPMLETVDPVNLEYMLRLFRIESMPS